MSTEYGEKGTNDPTSDQGDFNSLTFVITQLINRIHTCVLVKVISVTNTGGLSPVGFVDVQPLVNQVDGFGNPIPHGIIHHCPYHRLQGGVSAVILDPVVNDIGIALFAERDSTQAISAKGTANPGSARKFSMSDGLYLGGVLNGVPTQYVQFSSAGINMTSTVAIALVAPDIKLTAPTMELVATTSVTITTPTFTVNGNIIGTGTGAFGGDVTGNGHSLTTHHHAVVGVQTGGSTINTGNTIP